MSVQVRPNGLLTYTDRDENQTDTDNLQAGREKLTRSGYTGDMSTKAVSKVKKYVTNWVTALNAQNGQPFAQMEAQAKRLRFVTLTLPASQRHSDNELKRVFSTWFMVLLKRRYGVESYLWRAETQKSGGLHFHVLIDRPVPHLALRRIWNSCIEPLGYIQRYRENQEAWHSNGFRARPELFKQWDIRKQKAAYLHGKETNWAQPNTTDIHALQNVKNVVSYVVKYVSKNSPTRKVEGRLWGCSDDLRALERFVVQEDAELLQLLSKAVEDGEAKLSSGDGWSFYTCDTATLLEKWFPGCSDLFVSHWQTQAAKLSGSPYISKYFTSTKPPPCTKTKLST